RPEIGFMVMLPQSLNQRSRWMSELVSVSKPAAASASTSGAQSGDRPGVGAPTMMRSPASRWTWPGAVTAAEKCVTVPITWSAGRFAPTTPPGSTLSRRSAAGGRGRPWPNHQGTPFIIDTMRVSGPTSGPSAGARAGRAPDLRLTSSHGCGPSSAAVAATRTGTRNSRSPSRSDRPFAPTARSVSPRASALTSMPLAASRAPRVPPTAPRPTMQMLFMRASESGCSVAVRGIDPVDAPDHGIEHILARAVLRMELQRVGSAFLADPDRDGDCLTQRRGGQLHLAGTIEQPDDREGARQRVAPGEQPVVAQDHRLALANAAYQARPFVGVHRDAFEVVVGELAVQ